MRLWRRCQRSASRAPSATLRRPRAMHPCHKPSRSAPRMGRHYCRCLDLDTMHRPRARPSGCRRLGAVIRFAVSVGIAAACALRPSLLLECEQGCLRLARRLQRLAHRRIDVVPPSNEWHIPSSPLATNQPPQWQSRSFLATSHSSLATAFFADSNSNIRLICCQDRRRSGAVTRAPTIPQSPPDRPAC